MRLSIIRMMPPLLAVDWQTTFLSPPFYSAGNNRIPLPPPFPHPHFLAVDGNIDWSLIAHVPHVPRIKCYVQLT